MSAAVIAATSAANSAQSSINLARQKARCEKTVSSFDSKNASVQEMRGYASCVNQMYPSDGFATTMAVCFLISVLVGVVFAAIKGRGAMCNGMGVLGEAVIGFVSGLLGSALIFLLGGGVLVAVAYVASRL